LEVVLRASISVDNELFITIRTLGEAGLCRDISPLVSP